MILLAAKRVFARPMPTAGRRPAAETGRHSAGRKLTGAPSARRVFAGGPAAAGPAGPVDLDLLWPTRSSTRWERPRWAPGWSVSTSCAARAEILSLHAPNIPGQPAHDRAVPAAALAGRRDRDQHRPGAILDHDALLAECRTGRLAAILDVTDPSRRRRTPRSTRCRMCC